MAAVTGRSVLGDSGVAGVIHISNALAGLARPGAAPLGATVGSIVIGAGYWVDLRGGRAGGSAVEVAVDGDPVRSIGESTKFWPSVGQPEGLRGGSGGGPELSIFRDGTSGS